jgi:hypothetical protein
MAAGNFEDLRRRLVPLDWRDIRLERVQPDREYPNTTY